jgi:hypothetical protein
VRYRRDRVEQRRAGDVDESVVVGGDVHAFELEKAGDEALECGSFAVMHRWFLAVLAHRFSILTGAGRPERRVIRQRRGHPITPGGGSSEARARSGLRPGRLGTTAPPWTG